jgi:RNA polymerase sigma-70 factor (ECF subfamily)
MRRVSTIAVDPEVVRRVQRGEPDAVADLVRCTYTYVYSLARRLLADPVLASDATQEVFVHVLRSVHGFRGQAAFGTWLHKVTVNVCLAMLRSDARATRRGARPGPLPFATPDDGAAARLSDGHDVAAETLELHELRARLEQALAALPDDARTVVVLRDVEGLSTAEVAETLGISESAVKVRLCRAHARLRQSLRAEEALDEAG